MPHGLPDWGLVGPKDTTYGLDDLGEHAARLGSPHLYDRRGDVLWVTDFRNGMGDVEWGGVGALSTVQLWTGASRQGAYAVNLFTDADGGNEAHLEKHVPLPVASRIGVEFSFSVGANTGYIEAYLRWNDGAAFWYGYLRYDRPNNQLLYESPAGVWNVLTTVWNLYLHDTAMHTMKLVIDPTNVQYVRAMLDDVPFTIAPALLVPMGPIGRRGLEMRIYHWTDGTGTEDSFVDNVILTHNEP